MLTSGHRCTGRKGACLSLSLNKKRPGKTHPRRGCNRPSWPHNIRSIHNINDAFVAPYIVMNHEQNIMSTTIEMFNMLELIFPQKMKHKVKLLFR